MILYFYTGYEEPLILSLNLCNNIIMCSNGGQYTFCLLEDQRYFFIQSAVRFWNFGTSLVADVHLYLVHIWYFDQNYGTRFYLNFIGSEEICAVAVTCCNLKHPRTAWDIRIWDRIPEPEKGKKCNLYLALKWMGRLGFMFDFHYDSLILKEL